MAELKSLKSLSVGGRNKRNSSINIGGKGFTTSSELHVAILNVIELANKKI